MDRTEATVRNMLGAIEAPLYDVGVLSDRGMLPGLDGIPAETVINKLSLLKYRNARGSHIYIRPSGEHRYSVLDDLTEISLAKLTADGFNPCAVVETSAGNFQAGSNTRRSSRSCSAPSPRRRWQLATTAIPVQRTGDASADCLASLTASPSTRGRMASFRSFVLGAALAGSTR